MKVLALVLALLTIGCGQNNCQNNASVDRTNGSQCQADSQQTQAQTLPPNTLQIQGSITSAFTVTVDGTTYADIESYYTSALGNLQDRVKQAGYVGYSATLEARLGFLDLVTGMTVYVQTTSARGYEGMTSVGKNLTFSLALPAVAAGDTYEVRANKRIDIVLVKGRDIKKICYNFSAINMEVPYNMADKPVIMNTFRSEVTAYACQVDAVQPSLEIPSAG
jgi:hypothetical protein